MTKLSIFAPSDDLTVGVVIPVYNRPTLLVEALESVAAQTLPPSSLVVVDDGSTDQTAQVAQRWLTTRSPIFPWRVLREPHRSAAAARKVGFRHVRFCHLVAFLDSDDRWPVDFLERLTKLLSDRPDAVAASVDRCYVDPSGQRPTLDDCAGLARDPLAWLFWRDAGVASCTVVRSFVLEQVGGWKPDLMVGEDIELFCSIAMAGRWLHAPGEPALFRIGHVGDEDSNLSLRHVDRYAKWAEIYERVYEDVCHRAKPTKLAPLRAALSRRWALAGKHRWQEGDLRGARDAFLRSLQWKPTEVRSWRRLITTSLGRRAA